MLADKVVLISGASSGIGEATAEKFASHGCCLALNGRNVQNLQRTVQKCRKKGVNPQKILVVPGDVAIEKDVKQIISKTIEKFGRLDILVNNAGILGESNITDNCNLDAYDNMMQVNTKSVLMMLKYAVPHLIKVKGSIVNVSSISGLRPMANVLFYGMSKAAMDQMTRNISVELAEKGVRVNSVNPGVIQTDIHLRSGMPDEKYRQYLQMQRHLHPIGRHGQSEEVAEAIYFLASPQASFIVGQTIAIDGGRINVTPRTVAKL